MLAELQLRNFRCFDALAVEFAPGFNFFIAQNGQGKTSILEAACVLVRLQSQRSSTLAPVVRFGEKAFGVSGRVMDHRLEFRYSALRRKVSLDGIEQRPLGEYLRLGRVVSFANTDIELVRGGSEARRRYLDFLGTQIDSLYRPTLRAYERALRSRNALLKSAHPRPREIAAYDLPLIEHGTKLGVMRARLVERLAPLAEGTAPLLLLDDIFGELDPGRRNALLAHLPADAQKLVTATTMQWRENHIAGPVFELRERQLKAL